MPKKSRKHTALHNNSSSSSSALKDKPSRIKQLIATYKAFFILAILVVVVGLLYGIVRYYGNQTKFSEQDFNNLSSEAEDILRLSGGTDIVKSKYCDYATSGVYDSSSELYCTVEMAAYLPYENDKQAISTGQKFEKEMGKLGHVTSYFSEYYQRPYNNIATAGVDLDKPVAGKQCSFYMYSNDKAKSVGTSLPSKDAHDLIAIYFSCYAESREAYFPLRD